MGFKKRSKQRLEELLHKGFTNGKSNTIKELADYLAKNGVIATTFGVGENFYVVHNDEIHKAKLKKITLEHNFKNSIYADVTFVSCDYRFHYGALDEPRKKNGLECVFRTKREAIRWQKAQKGE